MAAILKWTVPRVKLASLTSCVTLLAVAATAHADSRMTIDAGVVTFYSEDPAVANELLVETRGSELRFYEPRDPKGITYPIESCRPGQTGNATVEVFCAKAGLKAVAIEIGPDQDKVRYTVTDLSLTLAGGTGSDSMLAGPGPDTLDGEQGSDILGGDGGNDDLLGGEGNDTLQGGDGNDKLTGGTGVDTVDAGSGDDAADVRDGIADEVVCGEGSDTVTADTLDDVAGDCEAIDRRFVEAPADQPSGEDHTPPTLRVGGYTGQAISRRRSWVEILATSSEAGLVQAAAYVEVAGINDPLKAVGVKIAVAGAGTKIRLRFSRRQLRLILTDLRRRRHPRVRVTLSSVDAAGNTSRPRRLTIRLRLKGSRR